METEAGRNAKNEQMAAPHSDSCTPLIEAIASLNGWSRIKSLSPYQGGVVTFGFPITATAGERIDTIEVTIQCQENGMSNNVFTVTCPQLPELSEPDWGMEWTAVVSAIFTLFNALPTIYARELKPLLVHKDLVAVKDPLDPTSLLVLIDRTTLLTVSLCLSADHGWITSAAIRGKEQSQYGSILSRWDTSLPSLENITLLFPTTLHLPRSSLECAICGAILLGLEPARIICPSCLAPFHHDCCLQWLQMDPECRSVFDQLLGHCPACSTPLQLDHE